MRPRRRLSAIAVSAILAFSALPLFAGPVAASHIAGATYLGTHAGGGTVTVTVTADGSAVDSHSWTNLPGTTPSGTCTFTSGGSTLNIPITDHSFDGTDASGSFFRGTFSGAQSVSGTLRSFFSGNGCDSGTVTWSATTASVPDSNQDNEADFRAAWADPLETLITLTADITLACDAVVDSALRNSATPIVVDGAGFTISFPSPCSEDVLVQAGLGLVTLRNLTLTGNADSGDGLNTAGGAVVEAGSAVTGHGNDGVDTQLDATIVGSTVSGNGNNGVESEANVGVSSSSTISGNGDFGIEAEGIVTVSGSTISGNADSGIDAGGDVIVDAVSTISDNDTNGINAGGDVTVTDSTISSNENTGIDADGDVTVTGSTISDSETECGYGIRTSSDASVDDSTITGNADSGIRAGGDITVADSDVSGNGVEGGCDGEGIRADGDVSVTDSTVNDNSDDSDGVRAGGDATILRSTISGNGDDGGNGVTATNVEVTDSTITANSIDGASGDFVTVTNSTITDHLGAGVNADVDVFAAHATITGNQINIQNAGFETIHLFGTVLLDASFVNCWGQSVVDEGYNFVDDDSCVGIEPETDDDPLLGLLADNGGPTFTRLPAAGSPLLDAIPDADCEETTEQRGLNLRPQGAGCDTGSVEVFVPLPAVSIADAPDVVEGNTGTTIEASFVVTLSKSWTRTVTVAYATANGSATAPADFVLETGTVTFAPGDVSETITVTVVGDPLDEPNETFVVNLSAPVEATIADAQGTGTILDDDGPAALSINDVTVTEGDSGFVNATFTVRLLPASSSSVTVAYATANGTALAPADYESTSGTVTFAAGDTEETITVRVAGDAVVEATETFVVNLTAPTGGAIISDPQGTGTILDNDVVREATLGATSLPDTSADGAGLDAWGAGAAAIGLVGLWATVLTRNRRRQSVRTR